MTVAGTFYVCKFHRTFSETYLLKLLSKLNSSFGLSLTHYKCRITSLCIVHEQH